LFSSAGAGTSTVTDEAFHEDPNLAFLNMTADGTSTGTPLSTAMNWTPDPNGYDDDSWSACS